MSPSISTGDPKGTKTTLAAQLGAGHGIASPLTDAVALGAVRLQIGSLRASINSDDERARADNPMANVACGNARLGHGHA